MVGPKFRILPFSTLYSLPWNGVVCDPAQVSRVSASTSALHFRALHTRSFLLMYMVPRLHQSNVCMKRKLPVWRALKCKALVGEETPHKSVGSQTTPLRGREYRADNVNMQTFGPTNSHGAAFSPKHWLHQKEAMGMERSKL